MRLLELARGSGAADTCQDEWRAEFTAINFRSVLTGLGFLAMPFCKVAGVDVERDDEVFALVGSAAGAARLCFFFGLVLGSDLSESESEEGVGASANWTSLMWLGWTKGF